MFQMALLQSTTHVNFTQKNPIHRIYKKWISLTMRNPFFIFSLILKPENFESANQ